MFSWSAHLLLWLLQLVSLNLWKFGIANPLWATGLLISGHVATCLSVKSSFLVIVFFLVSEGGCFFSSLGDLVWGLLCAVFSVSSHSFLVPRQIRLVVTPSLFFQENLLATQAMWVRGSRFSIPENACHSLLSLVLGLVSLVSLVHWTFHSLWFTSSTVLLLASFISFILRVPGILPSSVRQHKCNTDTPCHQNSDFDAAKTASV